RRRRHRCAAIRRACRRQPLSLADAPGRLVLPRPHPARSAERPRLDNLLHLGVLPLLHRPRAAEAAREPAAGLGDVLAHDGRPGPRRDSARRQRGDRAVHVLPAAAAHWAFYVGLTLVVVGTWLVTLNLALTWR